MREASSLYRVLGDEARLRLLRVLSRERLNVTELTGVLGLAQSGVSRHLGLLKDAGLVAEERDGGFSYYRLAPALADPGQPGAAGSLAVVLRAQFEETASDSAVRADDARLQEVLRLRKENFDAHTGPDTRDARQLVPGRSWAAWSRALGLLMPPVKVADLGCGEGYLAIEAARWASRVVAVDRSEVVLERARAPSGGAAASRTSSGRRASSRSCRSGTPRWTSRCCRRRCTTRAIRSGLSPKQCASRARAGACSCWTYGRTRKSGSGPSWETAGSGSRTRISGRC